MESVLFEAEFKATSIIIVSVYIQGSLFSLLNPVVQDKDKILYKFPHSITPNNTSGSKNVRLCV